MSTNNGHRIKGKIQELQDSGYRVFFIDKSNQFRERYYDDLLYSSSSQSTEKINAYLRRYFLDENEFGCELFLQIMPQSSTNAQSSAGYEIALFSREGEQSFDEAFSPQRSGVNLDAVNNDSNRAEQNNEQETAAESTQKSQAGQWPEVFRRIDRALQSDKKIAIYIDGIDGLAKIYHTERELDCIETLKRWENFEYQDKYLVCSLEKIPTYKDDYCIDFLAKKNFFRVGTPKSNEIYYSLVNILAEWQNCSVDEIEERDAERLPCGQFFGQVINDIADLAETEQKCLYQIINFIKQNLQNIFESETGGTRFFEEHFISPENKREKITLADIVLSSGIKNNLEADITNFLDAKPEAKAGLILHGPPGTGKTEIAKAIANQYKCAFKAVTITDLKKGFVGQSGQAVKELYDELEQMSPVILFIDEIDSIFSMRNSQHGDSFTNDIVNAMLPRIDGFKSKQHRIFLIGATNNYQNLDSAITSRLNSVEIALPNSEQRKEILLAKLEGNDDSPKLECVLNTEELTHLTEHQLEGFSGRDIFQFVKEIRRYFQKLENESLRSGLEAFIENSFQELRRDFPNIICQKNSRDAAAQISFQASSQVSYLEQIIGMETEKAQLERHFSGLELTANQYTLYLEEVGARKGILLYGPPGNGKSYIMEQVAKHYGLIFIKALVKDIQQPAKIHPLFDTVYKICKIVSGLDSSMGKAGVLLFFDEIDGLLRGSGDAEIRAAFLDCLAEKKYRNVQNLFIAGATNFYYNLDSAAIRTGRFDLHLPINGILNHDDFRRMLAGKLGQRYNLGDTQIEELFNVMREAKQFNFRKKQELNPMLREQNYDDSSALISVSDIEEIAQEIKDNLFNALIENRASNQTIPIEQNLINEMVYQKR